MKNLLSDIRLFLNRHDTIIQFSPPRTGSTLIFNILRIIFHNKKILKLHNMSTIKKKISIPIIVTVRNPLDSISSILRVNEEKSLNSTIITEYINYFVNDAGIKDVLEIANKDNVLILKYEEFQNDFEYIFEKLEKFFSIEIKIELRNEIIHEFNIDKVKEKQSNLKNFSQYDKISHIHGNHISEYNGKSYYEKLLDREYIDQIINDKIINMYMSKFKYEK